MAVIIKNPILSTFIHLEKNAGKSIIQWLEENFDAEKIGSKHIGYNKLYNVYGDNLGFTYAVVRNPWDRVVSGYHYQTPKDKKRAEKSGIEYTIPSFEEWVKHQSKGGHYAFALQTVKAGNVDLILRFENLEKDFQKIQKMLNCYKPLKILNRSEHNHYRNYYNEETKNIVAEVCKKDIEAFEYTF